MSLEGFFDKSSARERPEQAELDLDDNEGLGFGPVVARPDAEEAPGRAVAFQDPESSHGGIDEPDVADALARLDTQLRAAVDAHGRR